MATKPRTGTAENRERAPQGARLTGNIGPGTLFPGAGKMVQRTQQPVYCGAIVGRAMGYTEHANAKDAKRTSIRFAGQFLVVKQNGDTDQGAECYLPGTVQRAVRAALDLNRGEAIGIAIEVWCEPDPPGRETPLGYSYVAYDRNTQAAAAPLLSLAYETGILERPAITDQRGRATYDPETGEELPATAT